MMTRLPGLTSFLLRTTSHMVVAALAVCFLLAPGESWANSNSPGFYTVAPDVGLSVLGTDCRDVVLQIDYGNAPCDPMALSLEYRDGSTGLWTEMSNLFDAEGTTVTLPLIPAEGCGSVSVSWDAGAQLNDPLGAGEIEVRAKAEMAVHGEVRYGETSLTITGPCAPTVDLRAMENVCGTVEFLVTSSVPSCTPATLWLDYATSGGAWQTMTVLDTGGTTQTQPLSLTDSCTTLPLTWNAAHDLMASVEEDGVSFRARLITDLGDVSDLTTGVLVSTYPCPDLDPTLPYDIFDGTTFWYDNSTSSPQEGVEEGTIERKRTAILTGHVYDTHGDPLSGVTVTVLDSPEFGYTRTRADGEFILVVNGGNRYNVVYEKNGYLSAQRQYNVPWQDVANIPDVRLLQLDPTVTTIDLVNSSDTLKVAQGTEVTDKDGTRCPLLLVPAFTEACAVMDDGTTAALSTISIRVTEYTVGEGGPEAMPAPLPPNTSYTYCAEFSVDEALSMGAKTVEFTQPIPFYLENFLDAPTGVQVPVGYYDVDKGYWIPMKDGHVVKIASITDGKADLVLEYFEDPLDEELADAGDYAILGISDEEREELASRYDIGDTLWRTGLTHFSSIDCNFNVSNEADNDPPKGDVEKGKDPEKSPSEQSGFGVIELQNQVFREHLPLTGTPVGLNYTSRRVPGWKAENTVNVSLNYPDIPEDEMILASIQLHAGGAIVSQDFEPSQTMVAELTWEPEDVFGRPLKGKWPAQIVYQYTYPMYLRAGFSAFSTLPVGGDDTTGAEWASGGSGSIVDFDTERAEYVFEVRQPIGEFDFGLGQFDAKGLGLGGWSLSAHHVYDPKMRVVYKGDGTDLDRTDESRISRKLFQELISDSYSPYFPPFMHDMVVAPNGNVIVAWREYGGQDEDTGDFLTIPCIYEVDVETGDATLIYEGLPGYVEFYSIDVDRRGQIFVADEINHCIYKIHEVNSVWTLETIAGTFGVSGFSGDQGPAVEALLNEPADIAVAPDDTIYISDTYNSRVRRIMTDGRIVTMAGDGSVCFSNDGDYPSCLGDEGDSKDATLPFPGEIVIADDGTVYVESRGRIRRIETNGIITTYAGTGTYTTAPASGTPAAEAAFLIIQRLDLDKEGNLYLYNEEIFFDSLNKVYRIDTSGILTEIAGGGLAPRDEGPALQDLFSYTSVFGMAVSHDGRLLIAEDVQEEPYNGGTWYGFDLTAVQRAYSQVSDSEVVIPDGGVRYVFTASGRHLRTEDIATGRTLLTFDYDEAGLLVEIEDEEGRVVTINREADGTPTSIEGPFGHETTLWLNSDGFLELVTAPDGSVTELGYDGDGGLLNEITSPRTDGTYTYEVEYDVLGRATKASDPSGGFTSVSEEELENGYEVTKTTAEGRESGYAIVKDENNPTYRGRINRSPDGLEVVTIMYADGPDGEAKTQTTFPNGTIVTQTVSEGDPSLGPQYDLTSTSVASTPYSRGTAGLVTLSTTTEYQVTLVDPDDRSSAIENSTSTITAPQSRVSRVEYDASVPTTRTLIATSPEGRKSRTLTDDQDRTLETALLTNGTTSVSSKRHKVEYDYFTADENALHAGFLEKLKVADRVTTYTYDSEGRLSLMVDPLGREVSYEYDANDRPTTVTLPGGRVVVTTYDESGNVVSISPPGKPAHVFEYTAVNLPDDYEPPTIAGPTASTVSIYNADRELIKTIRPDGDEIEYIYEDGSCNCSDAGRLKRIETPEGDHTMTYDEFGRLVRTVSPGGEEVRSVYDGALMERTEIDGVTTGTLSWLYNPNDLRVEEFTVQSGAATTYTLEMEFDDDGLLTELRDGDSTLTMTFTRDADTGDLTATALGRVNDALTYTAFGEVDSYTASVSGNELFKQEFTYDKLGRITGKVEYFDEATSDVWTYGYDDAGRLYSVELEKWGVGASIPWKAGDRLYGYDANGNRNGVWSWPITQASQSFFEHDDQDRLLEYYDHVRGGTVEFTYNTDGEIVEKTFNSTTEAQYTYDSRGFLESVTLGSDTITYDLDGQGRRVARKENGVVKDRFLYKDFINPVAWQDAGGSVAYFVYGGRGHVPDWMVKGGAYYRFVTDHLGSVRRVVNVETGTVAQAMDYDEWGNVIADSSPGFQPFGYAGGLYDRATGLVHFGFREYSPETGRWMTKDPIGFGGGENFYGYLNNSPVTYNDPLGLRFPDDPTGTMHLWGTPGYVADAIRSDLVSQGYRPTDAAIMQLRTNIGNQWTPKQQRDILRNIGDRSDLPHANCAGLVSALNDNLDTGGYSPSKMESNNKPSNPAQSGSSWANEFGARGHLGDGHVFSSLGSLGFDHPAGSFVTILETNGAAGARLGRGRGADGSSVGGYTGTTVLHDSSVYPPYTRFTGGVNPGGDIRWYQN